MSMETIFRPAVIENIVPVDIIYAAREKPTSEMCTLGNWIYVRTVLVSIATL